MLHHIALGYEQIAECHGDQDERGDAAIQQSQLDVRFFDGIHTGITPPLDSSRRLG